MAWDLISNIFNKSTLPFKKILFLQQMKLEQSKTQCQLNLYFYLSCQFKKYDNKERFLTLNLALNPSVGFSTTAHFIILHHKLIQYARCQSVSHDSIFASNLYYLKRHVIWHHGDLVLYSCFKVFVTDHLIHSLFFAACEG